MIPYKHLSIGTTLACWLLSGAAGLNGQQQAKTETESQRPEAKRLVFRVGLGLHLVNVRRGPTAARLL